LSKKIYHRGTESQIKEKFVKNSVPPCRCGSILFGSGSVKLSYTDRK
jgi:hypothetical protein